MPQKPEDELDAQIIRTVEMSRPESVQQLIDQVMEQSSKSKQEILNRIMKLQQEGKIRLQTPEMPIPKKLTSYLNSNQALWYWITIALTIATAIVVLAAPEDVYPLAYLRYVLGTVFILWLPGYALIKALFPRQLLLLTTSEKDLDTIVRISLSIGMSIALVPMVGLLLNYTPWGIRLTPIVLSLVGLTAVFATAAIMREYQKVKESLRET